MKVVVTDKFGNQQTFSNIRGMSVGREYPDGPDGDNQLVLLPFDMVMRELIRLNHDDWVSVRSVRERV